MSGKPEPPRAGASASGLHNVVVYVSGDGFGYPQQNNGNNAIYQSASTVKPKVPAQGFYNVHNGYQGNNVNYSSNSVVNQIYPPRNASVGRREDGNFLAVMGGESGIEGTVVFPRCDSARSEVAESSCSSLSSSGGDSQSDSRTASTDNVSVSVSATVTQQQFKTSAENNSVTVPFGWKRLHTNGMVIYVSPSNTALSSLDQVKAYLQTQGTCKCGLECPIKCDIVFNFDPKVATRPWSMASAPPGDLTKLCNHKRKLLAMNSIEPNQLDMKKIEAGTARKKRRPGNVVGNTGTSTGSASVSQLLAQRERERSKESAQGWSDGSTQMGRDGSPMMMQGQMVSTPPIANRSVYLPGYQDRNASHPTNHPNGTPFFRYNPHTTNVNMNQCASTHPGQQPSQMIENNQMMSSETGYTVGNNVHSPVVMTNAGNQNQNANVVMHPTCATNMNSMMFNHQQQNMNFYQQQQQQRLHMNCDNTETQHGHCNPINKPVMNQQQQIILQQQQQQQQQLINQQSHFQQHQLAQHNMPQHVMNPSSSPRPQHNQHMVPSSHHHYENRIGQQFQNQQFTHQEHHNMNKMHVVQQQHCNKPQVMSVNRDSYQNRSDIPVSLHQIQQGSTMVLQTSQGQVMLPNGQTVGQTMVLHNQQGSPIQVSQSGICQQNQMSQPIQTMSLQGSSMVVQTSTGATLIPSGNQQNQMVLHGQQNSQMVQQGLQVQTIPGQQATVVLQGHQTQNIQNSQVQNNNGICTSPAMLMHHQRPAPPWQQNRNHNVINQQQLQPNPYERVPPLHHHTPPAPVWNDDASRKKNTKAPKPTAHLKKRSPYNDHHSHHHNASESPCPNVDVRHLPQDQNKPPTSQAYTNNIPSFMEDPSGYLAQQTALLNSTISRQTGVNSNGVNIICHSPCNSQNMNDQNNAGQVLINIPTSNCSPVGNQGVPIPSNVLVSSANKSVNQFTIRPNLNQPNSLKVYRSNSVSSTGSGVYHNQSQTGIPDSSGVSPDRGRCPQGCSSNMFDNIQQNQHQHGINIKQFQSDDNPVTSSTFMENRGQVPISMSDNRGPIQGGTVSTSNRSPVEMNRIPPDDPSPGGSSTPSSSQNCHIDASPEPPNIFISASSPYTITNANQVLYSQNQTVAMSRNQDVHPQKHQNINVLLQDIVTSRVPTVVTTMASGHTVSSNTITSVLAGRANTATVTVNNPTTVTQTIPSNILTNQQISQVSLPKSPLEMVQSVVSSIQVPASSASNETVLKSAGPSLPTGHILVSSNGQLIVTNNPGPSAILSPQQNMQKLGNPPMPPMTGVSSIVTSVTGAVTQVIPTVGVTQQVLGQPTVLVNTLQAPLLFQPGVMTVDGTMNTVQIPHLAVATNNVIQGQMVEDNRVNNSNGAFSPRNQPALLSPEGSNGKRKSANKKRKVSPQTVASMLHIAAQQNSPNAGTSMVVQQQQPQQNYGNATPMLQALTILPSKGGHFGGTQQLIATANVLQPLNLVQNFPTIQQFIVPAGLGGMVMATGDGTATLLQDTVHLNVLTPVQGPGGTVFGHTSGQSILTAGPAGMVIRTPNNSQQGKMLHPQNVTTNGGGQFIANSPNQLFMNSPAAFGGQLSPMLNVSPTNQQIHSFNTQGTNNQNRPGQAEFIQCGQTLMVPCSIAQNPPSQNTTVVQQNTTIVQQQTTMVSNNQQTMAQSPGPSTSSSSSLSLNQHNFILNNSDNKQQNFIITADKQGQGNFILSPNPDKHQSTHIILNNISPPDKQSQSCGGFIISQEKPNQMCGNFILSNSTLSEKSGNFIISGNIPEKQTRFAKHSVSTQTAANQQVLQVSSTPVPTALVVATTNTFCQTSTAPSSYSGSPPDTTTHSPIDGGPSQSPGLNSEAPTSSVAIGSDDNLSSPTSSSDPSGRAQPMVHCVSSSNEQDSPDWTSKEGTASSPAVFSPPPVSMELMYNRNVGGALKTLSMNSYVESSSAALHYEAERIHKRNSDQELLARQIYEYGSHARMNKRKHTFDNEARIHTSTVTTLLPQDDEDGESDESDLSSVSEGEGPGPGAGDLVWGAARGFPSWPGKLVGPAPTPGRVWVRWFGGAGNLSEVDPSHLKTLSEGLEAHHRARKKFRKSRKLNSQLENAIQEAMAELDRMSETPQQGAPVPPHSLVIAEGKTKRTHR